MIRILITLALSIAAYFGLTMLVEFKKPEVAELTTRPRIEGTKLHAHGLPDQIIGNFTIDKAASQTWLSNEKDLDDDSKAYFASLQNAQSQFTFDGKSIWFSNDIADIPVEIIEHTEYMVKLNMLEPNENHKGSTIFFLQWDNKGHIWFSNYSHLESGSRKLYRARYTKTVKDEV